MMIKDLNSHQNLIQALQLWLAQRQELIIHFNTLCRLRPFTPNHGAKSLENDLLTFCQVLIDYVSMGQFEMFALLVKKIEEIPGCKLPPSTLLENLKKTSLVALEFSDKYCNSPNIENLDNDLNYLGEQIASRFDLEDDLVSYYPFQRTASEDKKFG